LCCKIAFDVILLGAARPIVAGNLDEQSNRHKDKDQEFHNLFFKTGKGVLKKASPLLMMIKTKPNTQID
jgi:hypothetical protein